MLFRVITVALLIFVSGCSSWVFRIDIPQGNYLEKKDIEKLQIAMSKEQVKFILGSPVVVDSFDKDTWHYVYKFKSGRNERLDAQKTFILKFTENELVSAEGDFELPESFNTPMEH